MDERTYMKGWRGGGGVGGVRRSNQRLRTSITLDTEVSHALVAARGTRTKHCPHKSLNGEGNQGDIMKDDQIACTVKHA